ncbi:MAG: RidA family protein [Polyangiaceae bacterium]
MKAISTTHAPGAIGPYSQAVRVSNLVFLSGQIPLDPATGKIVEGGIAEQTTQVMANLSAVLEAAGVRFANVAKTTIYLTDLADFQAVNEIYARSFAGTPPARATVQVSALPRGSRVEIDAIAVVED